MIKWLALIGASGHGKVVADIAIANGVSDIVFYDDRYQEISSIAGYSVIGDIVSASSSIDPCDYQAAIVTIGNAAIRKRVQDQLPRVAPALVHPSALVGSNVSFGDGTVIMPNAVINAGSVIGRGVIVNTGAIVEHDCVIGDFAHICPNAAVAGGVTIGDGSWIGIGSSVIQLVNIGTNVTVGAGAVVIRDIPDHQTVVGNPAQPIHRKDV